MVSWDGCLGKQVWSILRCSLNYHLVGPMKTSRTSVWLASLLAEIQLVYYVYETEEIAIALCC